MYFYIQRILLDFFPIEIVDIIYYHLQSSYLSDVNNEILIKSNNNSLIKYQTKKSCNWLIQFEEHMIKNYKYVFSDPVKINKIRNDILYDNYKYNRSVYKRKIKKLT